MSRKFVVAAGLTALVSGLALGAPVAHAVDPITVTSPSCNTLQVTNGDSGAWVVSLDSGQSITVRGQATVKVNVGGGGTYIWDAAPANSDAFTATYRTSVKSCTGSPSRPIDGDQNGDGKADVLGIQAGTGNLYYYRMTATTLADGVKAGNGWNNMVFMQQVNEIEGTGTPNYLIAVRNDGTLWRYLNKGYGKFSNGVQIGSGLTGYTNFTVTQTNHVLDFGAHTLVATKGDSLIAFPLYDDGLDDPYEIGTGFGSVVKMIAMRDFDANNEGDLITIRRDGTMWFHKAMKTGETLFAAPRRIGTSWGAMQTVSSPGSLNGDLLSDLIARRSDGNLYKYINRGGRWAEGAQIGRRWNGIRLLA
ncbi:hypothetical protein AAEX63_09925 [Luteococcus sp. H138]|uniref:hypothetical protein n=1 Tax=unclassified Luteococcus TaxID=2639923 RepID=UPI00313D9FBD